VTQSVKEGEKLSKGDSINFEIVKLIVVYPDFVNEGYTLEQVATFCDDNGIKLETTTKETNDVKENLIISQSRVAGTKVVSGVTLRVTYAIPKEETATDNKQETTTDNKQETNTEKQTTDKTEDTTKEDTTKE
jgi:beta-lactam-binding protein with PASTA domain